MKSFTAVALVVLAILASTSARDPASQYADKDFLVKQKFVFEILQHIHQDNIFVTKYDSSYYEYKPWEHLDDFDHHDDFEHFLELWQQKPMHDDEVFTVFYDRHREYAHGLVKLFYRAKDWNTFTHVAFWARVHCNKHLFVYSFTVASLVRKDLEGIVLPAIYEIEPRFFFDAETIQLAEKYKMSSFYGVKKLNDIYNVVIRSNYSNIYGDVNYDHNLAYFLEDVGLNAFYYYYNIDYPFWAVGPDGHELSKDRRGELYFFVHWQLMARYYLERLSHDLGEIPVFNMFEEVDSGYFSNLHYHTGVSFPDRHNHHSFYHTHNYEHIEDIHVYSQRIFDFIDKNVKYDRETVNVLGNIVQGNSDSIDHRFYGSLDKYYRHIVNEGRLYGKYHEHLPNTFMHYETSVRDPLFFGVYKDILSHYWRLMDTYPEYTDKDFHFPGVKIDNVHMPESLTTYFEYFDSDISNAVSVGSVPSETIDDKLVQFGRNSHYQGHSYVIKARQFRLNHKPFEIQLDVHSDKNQEAIVKVFIGPKYDENGRVIHLEHNYKNFFELDHYHVDLVAGPNTIKLNSNHFDGYVNDRTTYLELYQKLFDAIKTDYKFALNQHEAHCGVPNRLMLPRGRRGGMPYQFFFMVYPFHHDSVKQYSTYNADISCGIGSGSRYLDDLPFGFPFNRPVKHDYHFHVDNFRFHDVKIYHKDDTNTVV